MIDFSMPARLKRARPEGRVGPFWRLPTSLLQSDEDVTLLALEFEGDEATVEWLHPFTWDAGLRGVITATRDLVTGQRICLHTGPYGAADAAAHREERGMIFPSHGDGHRYVEADAAVPQSEHQDAAAWILVEVGDHCWVVAWEYSGSLLMEVALEESRVAISGSLPRDTFAPAKDSEIWGSRGPVAWVAQVDGGLDAGAAALRALIADEFVTAPDLSGMPGQPEFPCLVANSWGVGEDTSTERISAMMTSSAAVGAEVFVVDKGWERSVGDWQANENFPLGMGDLSDRARELGMGFGVWCGFGNADPESPVAREHPDWIATWRGRTPRLSFDNHALCLGHDPARDWILNDLRRSIAEFRLTWLIHDFESIARCDHMHHSHDPGAGEHAAEAAWHHILSTLKAEFPHLVLENCWNGSRPLDLAMIKNHHTTITEDHCLVHWNSLAKVGLGRYLPLDWQSAYMGAEDLPPRARIAPYVIGGPWIMMDDPATWSPQTRQTLTDATSVYRRWRTDLRLARISRPGIDRDSFDAVQATVNDGRALIAMSLPPGADTVTVFPTEVTGPVVVTDEWTGTANHVTLDDRGLTLPVAPAGDGLLISLTPEVDHRRW